MIVTLPRRSSAHHDFPPCLCLALSQTVTEIDGEGDPHAYAAGGEITPGSVDIALSVQAERFGETPATTAMPIYVV